jgi:heme exporter protein D
MEVSQLLRYAVCVGGVLLLALLWWWFTVYQRRRLLSDIRQQWGRPWDRERKAQVTEAYFNLQKTQDARTSGVFHVDERTWQDLDMPTLYEHLDRTYTTPGEQVLHSLLRTPVLSQEPLSEREALINWFLTDTERRETVALELAGLGRLGGDRLTQLLWEELPEKPATAYIPYALFLVAIAAPVFCYLNQWSPVLVLMSVFGVNVICHALFQRRMVGFMDPIGYLGRMLAYASRLVQIGANGLPEEYVKILAQSLTGSRQILKRTAVVSRMPGDDVLFQYVNMYFLIQVRAFFSVLELVKKHRRQLQTVYETLGFIDAMQSVASYRAGSKPGSICTPRLVVAECSLRIEQATHPLLEDAVPNSLHLDYAQAGGSGIIITGSNMSGKSTFLRTVGVNALLAQTLYTCTAASYRGGFFRLLTAIGRSDNLIAGKSYYLVEAEMIRRIVLTASEEPPALCIIDEMFRGTNAPERIAASLEVLRYLAGSRCCVLAATHDLEVPRMLQSQYQCNHFSENLSDDGLTFDYSLKPGISEQRNAIRLLGYLGYPKSIVDKAANVARSLSDTEHPES